LLYKEQKKITAEVDKKNEKFFDLKEEKRAKEG